MITNTAVSRDLLTVDEYYSLFEAGMFDEDDRVELIEGEIIQMTPIGSHHAGSINRLNKLLSNRLSDRAVISIQNPLRLSDYSEPEPDILVLKPRVDYYAMSHPKQYDVLLLIEVADSSIQYDRYVKVPLYARHGVPEVWIIDLAQGKIEVCRTPEKNNYMECTVYERYHVISPLAFPDVKFRVDEIVNI
ncbi:MAG TPA: Uma2 family endonuclease [Thermodesulfovibrionia bacterium]|nr:Uma2 family endonuclease [Thermodesulfovibrionia bacterium]